MTSHISGVRLRAFVQGTVSGDEAIAIAVHIDSCVRCASQVSLADPLAGAFAAMADPAAPMDLMPVIVAESRLPEPLGRVEIAVGITLLVAAAVLMSLAGDPVAVTLRMGVVARALWSAAGHLVGGTLLLTGTVALCAATVSVFTLAAARTVLPRNIA